MTKKRRQYSREFRLDAVRLLETSGKSAAQLERELGIGKGNLTRWKAKFAANGEDAFPGHGRLAPDQERLRELERVNFRPQVYHLFSAIVYHPFSATVYQCFSAKMYHPFSAKVYHL